jgi:hypothetical protein
MADVKPECPLSILGIGFIPSSSGCDIVDHIAALDPGTGAWAVRFDYAHRGVAARQARIRQPIARTGLQLNC